jgi:hypothetical protein
MTTQNKQFFELDEQEYYLGWLLAAKLAEWLGMQVGVIEDQYFPDGLTFAIDLPSGTAVFEIPKEFVEGNWKRSDKIPHVTREESNKAMRDCLVGYLVNKHLLIIPEKKEGTE